MLTLKNKKILVTGGNGFLGKYLVKLLEQEEAEVWIVSHKYNLPNYPRVIKADLLIRPDTYRLFNKHCFDYVFHLAGYNGGIEFNLDYPADIFIQNTEMALNVLGGCMYGNVKKVVSVVASCAYPNKEHLYETMFFEGEPHPSVACHGYAKRNLALASRFLHRQYDLNAITVCPTTIYGPGDNLSPQRSKVMGSLIAKFIKAKQEGQSSVSCWGNGVALREFIYVEDAAKYILLSLLKYDDYILPINIGSGQEISVKNLAETIAKAVEYNGNIFWNTVKPDGQLRKRLNRDKQLAILGDIELTPLEEGIKKTIAWYTEHYNEIGSIS